MESGTPSNEIHASSARVDAPLEYAAPAAISSRPRGPVFQNAYVWLVFVSTLDIICTWIVLWRGGLELNPVAARVISYGPKGLVVYKFLFIIFVIFLCEWIGRRNRRAATILIAAAIMLTCVPVCKAIIELWMKKHGLI